MSIRVPFLLILLVSLALAWAPGEDDVIELHPNGQVHIQYSTNAGGQKHGAYSEFGEDGTPLVKARYAEDLLDGREQRFCPGGERQVIANWRKGVLDGHFERFYVNGRSEISTEYKKGVESGKYMRGSEDGEWVLKASHKAGLLEGTLKVKEHGKTISQQKWKAGIPVKINGIIPFPRSQADLINELSNILAAPEPAPDTTPLEAERQASLRRLQAYRALCGLRYKDMSIESKWYELCHAAAVVCNALGRITHTPEQPNGVDDETYKKGAIGAKNSNLGWGMSMPHSVDFYLDDSDKKNVERVGHRRWCLNPTMKKTSFGKDDTFSAMWSMDQSGKVETKQAAVLYPPPGHVPVQMFAKTAAWSISPIKKSPPDKSKVKVTLQPLGKYYVPEGQPLKIDFLNVDTAGIGSGPCLIFRSDELEVAEGRAYFCQVSLNGGKSITYEYLVEFVSEPSTAKQ